MARVGAAVVANDDIMVIGEEIDDLAFGLVAPLEADDTGAGHGGPTRPAGRPRAPRSGNAKRPDRRVAGALGERHSPHPIRRAVQRRALNLPLLPTTTIGSFPQTAQIRELRRRWRAGELDTSAYEAGIEAEIAACIRRQEILGIDVLVHGEFERTDMVEYFGEQLDGFATTSGGWVQSYGSRCVKPPVLFGDVARPGPMTLRWSLFAASLTDRPVKGMLTGPVTMLEW